MINEFDFKYYIESQENHKAKKTISKIPKKHAALVADFKFMFKHTCTLPDDSESIGEMDKKNKKITVAAPWYYGKEHVLLHEIGHRVWEEILNDDLRNKWKKLVAKTKEKQKQNAEELFCQAYSSRYAQNKIAINNHPEWVKFIDSLPK